MKANIHPEYKESNVKCASCGTVFKMRSTRGDMNVDICSGCHPFFTGTQRMIDAAGRVDRFKKKYKMK
jgi:large subunit ribosomal protein L31